MFQSSTVIPRTAADGYTRRLDHKHRGTPLVESPAYMARESIPGNWGSTTSDTIRQRGVTNRQDPALLVE
jgi:hypothetical protein